jgi:hypothetical protein
MYSEKDGFKVTRLAADGQVGGATMRVRKLIALGVLSNGTGGVTADLYGGTSVIAANKVAGVSVATANTWGWTPRLDLQVDLGQLFLDVGANILEALVVYEPMQAGPTP